MKKMLLLITALITPFTFAGEIADAVDDQTRLEAHVARDAQRQPGSILAFSRVATGDSVLEIAPAGGYYTGLLSRVVGDEGQVYAVDPEKIFKHFPRGREGFPKYISEDPRDNVTYSVQHLDNLDLGPAGSFDQIWMVLYYHDTFWTGEDRAAMNDAFLSLLKPGGEYIVVDHHGVKGAAEEITQTLHRVDADLVMQDIVAAGFVLDSSTDVFSNKDDPRDDSVFLEHRRGNTDRFVWRFVKPD